jgi:hypothetical protein
MIGGFDHFIQDDGGVNQYADRQWVGAIVG